MPPAGDPGTCQDANAKLNGLRLVTVAEGLAQPIHMIAHASDPTTTLIAERGGTMRVAKGLRDAMMPVQLSAPIRIIEVNGGGERGLLSLALHPDNPARLFAFYNAPDGDSVVQEFNRNLQTNQVMAGRILYQAAHSASNHQGGGLVFGSDKMLYFTIGDNGGEVPGGGRDRALNPNVNFGKLFRVDPATGMAPAGQMGIIWALGLRNPFRMTADRMTGDLYIGDVGAGTEEVNVVASGKRGVNFGWSGGGMGDGAPLVSYTRQGGFAVIGGYVYRGTKNPCMQGRYFFSDRARGPARSVSVQNARAVNGSERTHANLPNGGIYSFGEDATGEMYILYGSGNATTAGRVRRIVE
jgi:hypothetical protein